MFKKGDIVKGIEPDKYGLMYVMVLDDTEPEKNVFKGVLIFSHSEKGKVNGGVGHVSDRWKIYSFNLSSLEELVSERNSISKTKADLIAEFQKITERMKQIIEEIKK